MRKLYFKGLLASLVLLISANVSAYDIEVDGFYYTIDIPTQTAEITNGETGYTGEIVIPDTFVYRGRTFKVTSIAEATFKNCLELTSVVTGDSLRSIGASAFQGCTGLTSFIIGKNVSSIGTSAFQSCTGLTVLTIPDAVTSLGNSVFQDCTNLVSLEMGSNVSGSWDFTFTNCSSLTSLTIPEGITEIWGSTFLGCTSLENLIIEDIEDSTSELEFRDEQKRSSNSPFENCPLKDVYIGRDCSYSYGMGWNRYEGSPLIGDSTLTSLTIGGKVKYISGKAFIECVNLENITIADGTDDLDMGEGGEYGETFYSFGNFPIKNLYIGRNYYYTRFEKTYVGGYEKKICNFPIDSESLENLTIGGTIDYIEKRSSPPYTYKGCTNLCSLTILNDAKIRSYAFEGCTGLKSLKFHNNVSIGDFAFAGCTSLTTLEDVRCSDIGESAFEGCTGLTSLIIPDCVTRIYESAFRGCMGLTSVTIPNSVKEIRDSVFSGCTALTSIYCDNPIPCWLSDPSFDKGHYLDATVYVPKGSCTAYAEAGGWKNFFNIVETETTGIENIGSTIAPTGIYTLSGKKVNKTQKGQMYIFRDGNGKAVKKIAK